MRDILRRIKQSLLLQIVIAIILALLSGLVFPVWIVRFFLTFSTFFGELISFSVPLILFGLIASTIASLEDKAGKLLTYTLLLSYCSSFLAGVLSFLVSDATFPHLISIHSFSNEGNETAQALTPYLKISIPHLADTTSTLVLSFILGLGGALLNKDSALRRTMDDFRFLMEKYISSVIIPFLPLYIYSLFLVMTCSGNAKPILITFSKIILLIFILHIGILLLQFTIAGIVAHRNPLKLLRTMLPAYMTALATQSSVATIPVTLRQTLKNGVSKLVSGFSIPLCATIHMSGSVLKITSCAVALMVLSSTPYHIGMFVEFIAMLCIMAIAAPGIPGGAIMAALPILASILGFSMEQQTLMISLYIIMDSFGTACNVTGDGAIALIIDKINSNYDENSLQ